MTEGDCEDGLECIFNEAIPDLPGTCMEQGEVHHYIAILWIKWFNFLLFVYLWINTLLSIIVTCCKENTAECLACEQRQEVWEYCKFHPWLRVDGCEGIL